MAQRTIPQSTGLFNQLITGLRSPFADLFRPAAKIQTRQPSAASAYLQRKRQLPMAFNAADWERALDYWDHRCAVCERPRGLWHTISQDHWIPLSSPECPGTDPTNILPLCHGADGCNNSKGKHRPEVWLVKKLGKRRAAKKLTEIQTYFNWVRDLNAVRLGCPYCGGRAHFNESWYVWECESCEGFWTKAETRRFENCPKCQCWMTGTHGDYVCQRCNLLWDHENLPTHEKCPGCQRGSVKWTYKLGEAAGWWKCNHCRGEWTFN